MRLLSAAAAVLVLAAFPLTVTNEYWLGYAINVLQFATLATAWAMFSGPTRYLSLASAAFFGIGAYTAAVLAEHLPWPAVLAAALLIGLAIALLVGLATLRLAGVHFVIFTFGLAELIRQLVTWYEANVAKEIGRYIFAEITQRQIYWQLAALFALVLFTGWAIGRSRLGLALRVIGDDETVARHLGIDTTRSKVLLFMLSAGFMTLVGTVMAPRWTYIDAGIAFNPNVSFQVMIMALFGGAGSLFGPLVGVLPLTALFEFLSARFPNHFSMMLGLTFLAIVFLMPKGALHALQRIRLPTWPALVHGTRAGGANGSARERKA